MFFSKKRDAESFKIMFSVGIIISFILWLIFTEIQGELSNQFGLFFLRCDNFIADTTNVMVYSSELDPYNNPINGFGEKAYPPLTYVFTYLLSKTVNISDYYGNPIDIYMNTRFMAVFMAITIFQIICLYALISNSIEINRKAGSLLGFAICISAPVLFNVERGNTMLVTALFVSLFLLFYDDSSKFMRELALLSFAIAFNLKITPACLGILLLADKKYILAVKAALYSVGLFILSLLPIKNGLYNIPKIFSNIQGNLNNYTSREGCTLDAALYSVLSAFNIDSPTIIGRSLKLARIGTWLSAILFLVVIMFVIKDKVYNSMLAVAVLVLLPSHSGPYNVLYFIPILILIFKKATFNIIDLILMAGFFIIYQDFMIWHENAFMKDINIGIVIIYIASMILSVYSIIDYYKKSDTV